MSQIVSNIKEWLFREKKNLIIGVVLLIAAIILWDLYGAELLPSNGTGIKPITKQLDTVGNEQSKAINGLDSIASGLNNSTKQVDSITKSVNTIAERNSADQDTLRNSADLIKSSQQIIDNIRTRGKIED